MDVFALIGFHAPGLGDNYVPMVSSKSVQYADVLVIRTAGLLVGKDKAGSAENINHWRDEVERFLQNGKTVISFCEQANIFQFRNPTFDYLDSGNSHSMIPGLDSVTTTKKHGTLIELSLKGRNIFGEYWERFSKYSCFSCLIDAYQFDLAAFHPSGQTEKVCGGVFSTHAGGPVVILPPLDIGEMDALHADVIESNKFGRMFLASLSRISKTLRSESQSTPPPEWVDSTYVGQRERDLQVELLSVREQQRILSAHSLQIEADIEKEQSVNGLLFESGHPSMRRFSML